MRYIDVPAKVLSGVVTSAAGVEFWPYDDGRDDPYWINGSSPRDYRWEVNIEVSAQQHSSHRTRHPFVFDASDVRVGDYIANLEGIAVQVVSVLEKSTDKVRCIVEDNLRYNTFRDPTKSARGIFSTPAEILIFEVNESGNPIVDPIPSSGVGASFYANLMSRFQNFEQSSNFPLYKKNHGFSTDDIIAADPNTNTFVKASPQHPYVVGTVSFVELGPDFFMINPIQKVEATFPYLPGDVGDVLYVSPTTPGEFSLAGKQPIILKLRNHTKTKIVGKGSNVTTTTSSVFMINHVRCVVEGDGSASDFISAVNISSAQHGVTAMSQIAASSVPTTETRFYGEPALDCSAGAVPTATINGGLVMFTTSTAGQALYGAPYSLEEDMAADINAANIPNIIATSENNSLVVRNTAGESIEIVNGDGDAGGVMFAGANSGSGLSMSAPAATEFYVALEAVDARAINLYDVEGTALSDFGLFSVENGVKAAGMFIEQGIRQAATYVVANIAARDALNVMFGDQCFVQDKGNGEWGHYIRTLDDQWVKIADKDSSETDAQTVEIEITHETDLTGVIYTLSGGSRVTFVTVTVTEQFNGASPAIEVGDADDNARLMTEDQNDLKSLGTYSTTPSYIYSGQDDVPITFTFDASGSTSGKAVIAISYT